MIFFVLFLLLSAAVPAMLAALMPGYALFRTYEDWRRQTFQLSLYALIITATIPAFMALSALWSIAPADSLERAAKVAGLMIAVCLLFSSTPLFQFQKKQIWVLCGIFSVLCSLIVFDNVSSHAIQRIVLAVVEEGKIQSTGLLNKANMILFFIYFILFSLFIRLRIHVGAALSAFIMSVMVFTGTSEATKLCFLITPLIVALAFYRPTTTAIALFAGYAVHTLIMPWVAPVIYTRYADPLSDILSVGSPGARLEIWAEIGRMVQQSPLIGYGVEATRNMEGVITEQRFFANDRVLHPHHMGLQLWVEMGIGAVLLHLLVIGYGLKLCLTRYEGMHRALGLGLMACLLISASLTFGIWQSWWIGAIILLIWSFDRSRA